MNRSYLATPREHKINALAINANTGKIRYAAVTYGGFLGMGDKLFAVTFEALKVQVDP